MVECTHVFTDRARLMRDRCVCCVQTLLEETSEALAAESARADAAEQALQTHLEKIKALLSTYEMEHNAPV